MRKLENEGIRELENEGIRKKGTSYKLAPEKINFAKVSNFGKVYPPKSDTSELSEGNGRNHKKTGRFFGEKRL